jgi:hypothetical protein
MGCTEVLSEDMGDGQDYAGRPGHQPVSLTCPPTRAASLRARFWTDRAGTDGKPTLLVSGRVHHIGIGREHARTPVLMLIQDLHVRIFPLNVS